MSTVCFIKVVMLINKFLTTFFKANNYICKCIALKCV